jgi:hypothetical protein
LNRLLDRLSVILEGPLVVSFVGFVGLKVHTDAMIGDDGQIDLPMCAASFPTSWAITQPAVAGLIVLAVAAL